MRLRGYMVSGADPENCAILVFDRTARKARRQGTPYLLGYGVIDEWVESRAQWLQNCKAKAWGVTEPCVIEPVGCDSCLQWFGEGPIEGRYCTSCAADIEAHSPPIKMSTP